MHFICTYLMFLFFRWTEYIWLYQSYDTTDQYFVWCTLFLLYSWLLLVIQLSLWCTLFVLIHTLFTVALGYILWIGLTLSMIWNERSAFPAMHFICTYSYFIWCSFCLNALNPVDFINYMTWQISFPCGALYLVSTLFALPCRLLNSLGAT